MGDTVLPPVTGGTIVPLQSGIPASMLLPSGGASSSCVCGPPGYCYGADFCSKPQLDSCGRDFRTDRSAGSPGGCFHIAGINVTLPMAVAAAGLILLFLWGGHGR